jgi:hypothetical protein
MGHPNIQIAIILGSGTSLELVHDKFLSAGRRVGVGSEAHAKDTKGVIRSAECTALAEDEQDDLLKVTVQER